jgi:hypothetical protein
LYEQLKHYYVRNEFDISLNYQYPFEPILADHRMKDLRSGWVTFGVRNLKIEKDTIAKANGRADVGTMERHYLAAPDTREAYNSVAAGISQLRKAS